MQPDFRILVLDDELEILELISRMLESVTGIHLVTAQTVERAIHLLNEVDGIIADCVLPEVDVFNRRIIEAPKPLIRMSGKIDRATNLEILKPFTYQQLIGAVEMLQFFHAPKRKRESRKILVRS
jgi:CheY-like chemotaxis protein